MTWKSIVITEVKNLLQSGKFHFVGNTIVSLLLCGFEALMEKELNCPCDHNSNLYYILVTFINPVVVLFIFGFMLHCNLLTKHCKHKKVSRSTFLLVFNALTPAVVWIVILFVDGDYYACSELIGKNETVCGSKCDDNPPATRINHCMKSQFIGGVVLIVFLFALSLAYCVRCNDNDQNIGYKVDYEIMCEKEILNLMKVKLDGKAHNDTEDKCEKTMSAMFPNSTSSLQQTQGDEIQLNVQQQISLEDLSSS